MNLAELEATVQDLVVGPLTTNPNTAGVPSTAGTRSHSGAIGKHVLQQLLWGDCIPEIIKRLPAPLPGVGPQVVTVSAWPHAGHSRIALTVRRNALPDTPTWYWAIDSVEEVVALTPAA